MDEKDEVKESVLKEGSRQEEIKKLKDIPDISRGKEQESLRNNSSMDKEPLGFEYDKTEHKSRAEEVARLREIPDYVPKEKTQLLENDPGFEGIAEKRFLNKLDQNILLGIKEKYGPHIPKERLEGAYKDYTRFQSHGEYIDGFKSAYPEYQSEAERIFGDLRYEHPYVDKDQIELPTTVAHERIHQLRNERFEKELGSGLNEGMTEHLAWKIESPIKLVDSPESYPGERRVVKMLEARVGDDVLAKAYFRGDIESMRAELDSQLGKGALDKIVKLTEEGRYDEAENVLKGES